MKPKQLIFTRLSMRSRGQRGVSLIMVMIILVIASLLGIGGAQIALMSERASRNDRDMQIAWQAAEAALIDAEFDMTSPTSSRHTLPNGKVRFNGEFGTDDVFPDGCGNSGQLVGLCAKTESGKPAWLTVDFTDTSDTARTTAFGAFSGRTYTTGNKGVQSAQAPRYIIELVDDPTNDTKTKRFVYRVTAMGFGPRTEIQAVMQMIYRN